MIKRNLSKYTKVHENLQTASFVASQGINITKAPTIREYVKDINNLDVSENGALVLRKTINAKTFGEGTPLGWNYDYTLYVYRKDKRLYVKNDLENLTIKIRLNSSPYKAQLDTLTLNTFDYVDDYLDFSNATLVNTATTTLLCGVQVKNPYSDYYFTTEYYFAQESGQYNRIFKLYTETVNNVLCAILEVYTPEYSYLDSSKTDVLVANMNADDAYNISDTYNTGTISIEGILGYAMAKHPTNSKDIKPTPSTTSSIKLTDTVRQCLCSLNDIKLTPFISINQDVPIVLKAFMNLSTTTTVMGISPSTYTYEPYICTWEYTFDGINYYTVPSFKNDNYYDARFKSFKCLVLDNSTSNLTLNADGTASSNTVSRREIIARKFRATGLDDIVNTRADILYIPESASLKGCTYRFTIYKLVSNDIIDVNIEFKDCIATSNENVDLETTAYDNLKISATLEISNDNISQMIDTLRSTESLNEYLSTNLGFEVTVDYLKYDLSKRTTASWVNLTPNISEWQSIAKTDTETPYKSITVELPQSEPEILPMYLVRVKLDYKYRYDTVWTVMQSHSKIICVHTINDDATKITETAISISNTDADKVFNNTSSGYYVFGLPDKSSAICRPLDRVVTKDEMNTAVSFYPCTNELPTSKINRYVPYITLEEPTSLNYSSGILTVTYDVDISTAYSLLDNKVFTQFALCINNYKLYHYIKDSDYGLAYSYSYKPSETTETTDYFKLYAGCKLIIQLQSEKHAYLNISINLADFATDYYSTIAMPYYIHRNDYAAIYTNLLITYPTNVSIFQIANDTYASSIVYNNFNDYYSNYNNINIFNNVFLNLDTNLKSKRLSDTRLSDFTKSEKSATSAILQHADIVIDEGSYNVSYTDTPEFLYTLKSIYSNSQQSNFKYLYYKYRLFTYGGSVLNNNILMSDSDSITTPIMNTIDLYASNNSQITSLTAWRDYLIAATNTTMHLISFNDSGTTSKIINTYVGIPESDSETLRSILNGIIFKSGNKIYTLNPNAYSSDDTLLSLVEISKPVANYVLTENVKKSFAITTTDAYYLFMALEDTTEVLKYEFTRAIWNRYTLPKSFIGYDLNDIDNIILYDSTGSSYEFNKECIVDISNNEYYGDTLFDDNGQTYRKAFEFSVDSGEKTTTLMITKQYVESKLITSPLNNPDIYPINVDIYVDGFNTFSKHIDCSSDHSAIQDTFSPPTESQSIALLNTNINANNSYVKNTLRQEFIRYSLKGKTIRHVISGNSYSNFELFVVYYKYKDSHVKQ